MPRQRVLLDADTGIDDSFALVYLLAHPDANLVGIASTGGNVTTRQVATNNLAWLELCGRPDIAVALGARTPVAGPLRTTEDTHGPHGVGYADLPAPRGEVCDSTSAELWVQAARRHPGELTGLVTGPLTNLALALELEPQLPRLLDRLVIMGGSFEHRGNTTPTAEWNITVDPEAARMVFDAFADAPEPPIVCGLNITETIRLTPERLDPWPTDSAPVLHHLTEAVRFYFEFHQSQGEGYRAFMHDPFAAALALHPERARCRTARAEIDDSHGPGRGTTLAYWDGSGAAIAWETDAEAFLDELVTRISVGFAS